MALLIKTDRTMKVIQADDLEASKGNSGELSLRTFITLSVDICNLSLSLHHSYFMVKSMFTFCVMKMAKGNGIL